MAGMKKKKNVTVDDLAVMVKGGFDNVDKRFEKLEQKMESGFRNVNARLDVIEGGK